MGMVRGEKSMESRACPVEKDLQTNPSGKYIATILVTHIRRKARMFLS